MQINVYSDNVFWPMDGTCDDNKTAQVHIQLALAWTARGEKWTSRYVRTYVPATVDYAQSTVLQGLLMELSCSLKYDQHDQDVKA